MYEIAREYIAATWLYLKLFLECTRLAESTLQPHGCPYTTLAGAVKQTFLGVYEIGREPAATPWQLDVPILRWPVL